MVDAAIIGTGPAGLSAALNLKIHEKNFIWLGSKQLSDKVAKAERIFNYPGLPDISGEELNRAFRAHTAAMGIEITEQMVNSILPFDGHFALMAGPEFFEAQTVLLTTGVAVRSLLPGEETFLGRGVSYCATCDGGLYRNRVIAAACTNPRFEHEIQYLASLAAQVHYFPLYREPGPFSENVVIHKGRITEILGEQRVTGIKTNEHYARPSDSGEGKGISCPESAGGNSSPTCADRVAGPSQNFGSGPADDGVLPVDGVFLLRDSVALSALLPGLEIEGGHIVVNRKMETSIPGVWAAGDCTGRPYQYTKAVGEGNVAAHSMIEYLEAGK